MLFIICLWTLLSIGTAVNMEREAVNFSPEVTAAIRTAIQKCIEKTGVPANTLDLVRAGGYLENDMFKEYVHCVFQDTGYANPDGHVIIPKVIELFPKEINILPVFEKCDKQGKDPAETIYLSFKCFQDTSPVRMAL